jgi:DNA-binding transcriptional LysR family regulator
MFDPKLALTFVAVADEKSFTRAATRLGVAQPWVSEQIRRLEIQLGVNLFARTSRRVALTTAGASFLPHARHLQNAYLSAQAAAKDMRQAARQRLRLGVLDFFVGYPERRLLIDAFVEAQPTVKLEIHAGGAAALFRDVEEGDLDAVMAFSTSHALSRSLEVLSLKRRYGHVLIPCEDPLAGTERLTLNMLQGRTIVGSSGSSDPRTLRVTLAPFAAIDLNLVSAPEPNRQTIEQVARSRRALCIRWSAIPEERHEMAGMVCVPIEGHPLISETALWRRRTPSLQAVTLFWDVARRLATRLSTEMAGEPLYIA